MTSSTEVSIIHAPSRFDRLHPACFATEVSSRSFEVSDLPGKITCGHKRCREWREKKLRGMFKW